ncbi:MAG: carbohydrate ABC transporter permease [Defluviitaleaceae bacterium]|nr:carbohydrate ABC transporter permease [Defluviitaleaceae bacterium]
MQKKFNVVDGIILLVVLLITSTSLIPIINTIMISFSDRTSVAIGAVTFWPVNFNLSSYRAVLDDTRFFTAFGVSVRRVLLGTTLSVFLSIMMAYPLSKAANVFPARRIYIWVMIFTMLFNGGLIPTFLTIRNLRLLDTIWALVLPGAVSVFNTIILMNFFRGLPKSLEEAAQIDGAHPFFILFKIFVPLSKAPLATISLFSAVWHWNSFFDGMIYIGSIDRQPLQTYLQTLTVELNPVHFQFMTPEQIAAALEISNITFNAAKAIIAMIPIIAIYPFLQRYFITGIVLGAVKE